MKIISKFKDYYDYLQGIHETGLTDEDADHWFYEAVMECVYGKTVWKWINNKTE